NMILFAVSWIVSGAVIRIFFPFVSNCISLPFISRTVIPQPTVLVKRLLEFQMGKMNFFP
ncbi:MAG: hypothetical protein LBT25_05880, partial [Candidatus Symbiothrix sp.]|nr:hypothetical protein [Candidatus Symbiothrix sp.]